MCGANLINRSAFNCRECRRRLNKMYCFGVNIVIEIFMLLFRIRPTQDGHLIISNSAWLSMNGCYLCLGKKSTATIADERLMARMQTELLKVQLPT